MGKGSLLIHWVLLSLTLSACGGYKAYTPSASDATSVASPPPAPPPESPPPAADPLGVPANAGTHNDNSLATGHDIQAAKYLPQLDAVGYWQSYQAFRAYDSIPVKVAILDYNFNTSHPDIAANISATYDFNNTACGTKIGAVNSDTCRNVFLNPSGFSSMSKEEKATFNHGTEIAGVIAGQGTYGKGAIGVNPSAKLILLKRDSSNNNLRALKGAIDAGVDVISISWPLGPPPGERDVPEFRALLEDAVKNKRIVVVMAAGNGSADVNARAIYPTRYADLGGVIAVAATSNGALAGYSNYGTAYVSMSAPGTIVSSGGNYAGALYSMSTGTSFSGPMVAAAASRVIQYMKSRGRSYTPADVELILNAAAKKSAALNGSIRDGNELNMPMLLDYLKRNF